MIQLDDLDRRLLARLRTDGRAPVAALARDLEVTRATVTNRITRLQDRGVIVGFTALIDDDADATEVRAVCQLAVDGRQLEESIEQLRGMPEVSRLYTTIGEWDLVAVIAVGSLPDVDRVTGRIQKIPGVLRSETSLLLRNVLV